MRTCIADNVIKTNQLLELEMETVIDGFWKRFSVETVQPVVSILAARGEKLERTNLNKKRQMENIYFSNRF